MAKTRKAISGLGFLAALLAVGLAQAALFHADVNTTGASGTEFLMAFDLNNGDSNAVQVTITNFKTDGALLVCPSPSTCAVSPFLTSSPAKFPTGADIIGTLSSTLVIYDTESNVASAESPITYYQNIILGSYVRFDFEMVEDPDSTGNGLTFWFLDPMSKFPGFAFANPPYNNFLFNYTHGDDPTCDLSDVSGVRCIKVQDGNGVPEPSALALALAGLLGIGFARSRRVGRVSVSALQG